MKKSLSDYRVVIFDVVTRVKMLLRSGVATDISAGLVVSLASFPLILGLAVALGVPPEKGLVGCVISSIILCQALKMGGWQNTREVIHHSWSFLFTWGSVFVFALATDITSAVIVGILLSALIRLRDRGVVDNENDSLVDGGGVFGGFGVNITRVTEKLVVIDISGNSSFEVMEQIEQLLRHVDQLPVIVILMLGKVTSIDAQGLKKLENLVTRFNTTRRGLVVCGVQHRLDLFMLRAGLFKKLDKKNVKYTFESALERAKELLAIKELETKADESNFQELGRLGRYPVVRPYLDGV